MEVAMRRSLSVLAPVLAVALVAAGLSAASAQRGQRMQRVQAGTLSCDISAGIGFIIGSQKRVACVFTPSQPGPREVYVGNITKFGLDVGVTTGGQMAWGVYAPTTRRFGALAGSYGGASAEATVGVGGGINVLFGGSDRTVMLQPLSVEGQTGFNVAAGVTGLELFPAR
jgi:hypothetical protein